MTFPPIARLFLTRVDGYLYVMEARPSTQHEADDQAKHPV